MKISSQPRKVVRWRQGRRTEHVVEPTPFGAERAKEIWEQKSFTQTLNELMTLGEEAYVLAVWDTIPDGRSSFMTAFTRIYKGQV